MNARNPFYLGDFEGARLRRAIATQRTCAALAVMTVAAVALLAFQLASRPTCRLMITDEAGDMYVAGEGDTFQDALRGAVVPANWRDWRMWCDR